jgi:outer membrane protein OmpA-like peptidoglycan-associated protein
LLGFEIVMRDRMRDRTMPQPVPAPVVVAAKPKVLDRDGDGIPDDLDKCPDDPEDKDGFEDEDGCPDPDNDKDGIADKLDACPNEPETVNGVDDQDGCPDQAPIVVREDRIVLTEHVLFDTNRARVRSNGKPALGAVVNLWKQHPEWDHLVIEGHADRHGPDPFNDWLSNERAVRARKVIIQLGFPADKIAVAAYGRKQPRVQGTGEEADRANRRVEFAIIKKVEERSPSAAPDRVDPNQPPPTPTQPIRVGGLQP